MKIVTTKLSVQNCVWGISGEKEAHPLKVLCLRSLSLGTSEPIGPPLAALMPTKYCLDIFNLHHLSLITPKTVNLVKRSSKIKIFWDVRSIRNIEFKIMWGNLWTLGSSSKQNIVLEIIWGELPPTPAKIRELINVLFKIFSLIFYGFWSTRTLLKCPLSSSPWSSTAKVQFSQVQPSTVHYSPMRRSKASVAKKSPESPLDPLSPPLPPSGPPQSPSAPSVRLSPPKSPSVPLSPTQSTV